MTKPGHNTQDEALSRIYKLVIARQRHEIVCSAKSTTSSAGVEKVSDHGTIGPRKPFDFPENISPRKKNCNNLDKRRNSEENLHHDLRNAIISASILMCDNV